PAVVEFAESMLGGQETGEVLAQVDVRTASPWDGATLAEVLAGWPDVHVLGVRYKDGHLGVAPSSDSRIGGGDVLMVYGRTKAIEDLTASEEV
ncbi:MAG: TrkA C-terminal domain-containing protein, partial [Dehalococcoidia bacterium]